MIKKKKIKVKKSLAQSPNFFTIEKYLNLNIPKQPDQIKYVDLSRAPKWAYPKD
jgi:hypothetical protein